MTRGDVLVENEAWYLRDRMMAFNYDRSHGRGHTHHLQFAACALGNVSARGDACGHSLQRLLLTCCDNTAAHLK